MNVCSVSNKQQASWPTTPAWGSQLHIARFSAIPLHAFQKWIIVLIL